MELTYYCDNGRHLVCKPYSIENLHKMAADLNIAQNWYHRGRFPHYDIPKLRINEIQDKCNVVSSTDIVRIIKGELS